MQVEGRLQGKTAPAGWPVFLRKTALSLSCLLLASAGICWVAANWQHATRLQKLAGAQALLVVIVLLAAWAYPRVKPNDHNFSFAACLTGLAGICTGALLALVGQIYQTGADSWELFLLWAVLLLPWLLATHTVFLALLFAVLLNVSLALYLYMWIGSLDGWGWLAVLDPQASALLLAGLDLVLLAAWEAAIDRLDDRWRTGPRLLLAAVAGWLVVATLARGLDGGGVTMTALAGVLVMAACYIAYTRWRADLVAVSLAMAGGFVLIAVPLVYEIQSEGSLLLVIIVLLALAVPAIGHLAALARASRSDAAISRGAASAQDVAGDSAQSAPQDEGEPWFIAMFRLFVVGLISLLVIAWLAIMLDISEESIWLAGLALGAVGILMGRAGKGSLLQDLAIVLVIAGIFMFSVGLLFSGLDTVPVVAVLALGGVSAYLGLPGAVPRFVVALATLACLAVVTAPGEHWDAIFWLFGDQNEMIWLFVAYQRVWWFAVAAVLALSWSASPARRAFWLPLAWALVLLAQASAWFAPAPALLSLGAAAWPSLGLVWLACAALPVLALAALLWADKSQDAVLRIGAPAALAVASLGWVGAPGISLALLWLLFGHSLRRRSLIVFGVAAMLGYLGRFYYLLDISLLQKSWLLGLTGGWLLLAWLALRKMRAADRHADAQALPAKRHGRLASAGLLAGLVIVLAAVNSGIYQREGILRDGQRVVLALAPVDPRSLMQGDYMALSFDVAVQAYRQIYAAGERQGDAAAPRQDHGYLLLRPDANGVFGLAGLLASPEQANGDDAGRHDVALAFKVRNHRVRVVTDAWFFPEGQAQHFAAAKYGEFRVGRDGTGLLVRMLDGDLQPL
jgi:uncharacterized membrane protein/uncharacterized membrane-anchored protein